MACAADHRQVLADLDHARVAAASVGAHTLDQPRPPLVAGAEAVNQTGAACRQRGVAARRGKRVAIVLHVGFDRFRRKLARDRDVVAQHRPQSVEQVARGLAVLLRHVVAGEGLGEGLVFADAKHMHLHAQRVERLLEVGAVARQAVQQHEAVRRQMQFVRHRGEVVLPLGEALAAREHRLAGGLEVNNRLTQFGELGEAASHQLVGLDDQGLDARIVLRHPDRLEQVAERSLPRRRAAGRQQIERPLEHRLFDKAAGRAQQQRRSSGMSGAGRKKKATSMPTLKISMA